MKLLPQVSLSILLALSLKPRHGYEIIQQVQEDSEGKIKLGAGALYSSIKQLKLAGYIEEANAEADKDIRRIYYQLTSTGRARLVHELDYFRQSVNLYERRAESY